MAEKKNRKNLIVLLILAVVVCAAVILILSRVIPTAIEESKKPDKRDYEVVTLGKYEQDDDLENGAEPIAWRVLEKQEDKMLVISEKGLACKPIFPMYEDTTWETSELRQWLNEVFMKDVFTEEEQARIQTVTLKNEDNPQYKTKGGKDTKDKLFILSLTEAETYFEDNDDRMAFATTHAEEKGAFISDNYGTSFWWLRTPGNLKTGNMMIGTNGTISMSGERVDRYDYTVRPAMWIEIE